jgi:hypothetical protein
MRRLFGKENAMFVLDRRKGERFLIVGGKLRAHIKVLSVQDDQVRLGIRILAEVPIRPTANESFEVGESNGGGKQRNGEPRRTRRPRLVWPPVELVHTGWY